MIDLKAFRKKNKFTQSAVSDEIGVDTGRISRYESGKDRSQTIENLLLKHYPEIKAYEIEEIDDSIDLPAMLDRAQEKIEMQNKQIALLEELLEQYRKK